MKKLILALPLLAALGGCATQPLQVGPITIPIPAFINVPQVQADVVLACGFEPAEATIIGLIPVVGSAGASIVKAICDNIPKPVAGMRGAFRGTHVFGYVGNVPVTGRFVR